MTRKIWLIGVLVLSLMFGGVVYGQEPQPAPANQASGGQQPAAKPVAPAKAKADKPAKAGKAKPKKAKAAKNTNRRRGGRGAKARGAAAKKGSKGAKASAAGTKKGGPKKAGSKKGGGKPKETSASLDGAILGTLRASKTNLRDENALVDRFRLERFRTLIELKRAVKNRILVPIKETPVYGLHPSLGEHDRTNAHTYAHVRAWTIA